MHCKCIVKFYVAKMKQLVLFIKLWLLFLKFLKKTCFSQGVATGEDSIYKSSQLSAVK